MGDKWEQGRKGYKGGGGGGDAAIEFKQCGGDLWIGGSMMGDQLDGGPMEWAVRGY